MEERVSAAKVLERLVETYWSIRNTDSEVPLPDDNQKRRALEISASGLESWLKSMVVLKSYEGMNDREFEKHKLDALKSLGRTAKIFLAENKMEGFYNQLVKEFSGGKVTLKMNGERLSGLCSDVAEEYLKFRETEKQKEGNATGSIADPSGIIHNLDLLNEAPAIDYISRKVAERVLEGARKDAIRGIVNSIRNVRPYNDKNMHYIVDLFGKDSKGEHITLKINGFLWKGFYDDLQKSGESEPRRYMTSEEIEEWNAQKTRLSKEKGIGFDVSLYPEPEFDMEVWVQLGDSVKLEKGYSSKIEQQVARLSKALDDNFVYMPYSI